MLLPRPLWQPQRPLPAGRGRWQGPGPGPSAPPQLGRGPGQPEARFGLLALQLASQAGQGRTKSHEEH